MHARRAFSFIELVVTVVLGTMVMAGFAELIVQQGRQLGWIEGRIAAGGSDVSAALVVDDQALIAPETPLATVAVVDVFGVVRFDDDTLVATVRRRTALATDCGRDP